MKEHLEYGFYKFLILPGDRLRLTKYRGRDSEVTVPERVMQYTVTEIGVSAFSFSGIVRVTLPETVEEIEPGSFSECTMLESINIPGKVKTIGRLTFEDCLALEQIFLGNKSCEIDPGAFDNSSPEIILKEMP